MQYSRYLTRQGIAHVFFTPAYKDPKADDGAYPVVRFPSVPFALYPQVRLALPAPASLRRHLQAFQPDVVHIATEFGMGLAGLKAARQMNLPIVMSYHTNFRPVPLALRADAVGRAAVAVHALVSFLCL